MSLSILYGVNRTNWFEKISFFYSGAKKILKNSCLSCNLFTYLLQIPVFEYSMAISKKKIIKSLENLSGDLLELIHQQYPNGYQTSISRITNAKKEPIFVFPLDTEDVTYLIKVPVTKNSSGEYDVDSKEEEDLEKGEEGFDGGDDFDGGTGNADAADADYDEEGGTSRGNREASYDPDFDT
jgi:hypothetical protein